MSGLKEWPSEPRHSTQVERATLRARGLGERAYREKFQNLIPLADYPSEEDSKPLSTGAGFPT